MYKDLELILKDGMSGVNELGLPLPKSFAEYEAFEGKDKTTEKKFRKLFKAQSNLVIMSVPEKLQK